MKLFRLGKDLLLGEQKNSETINQSPLHHIEVRYVLGESGWNPVEQITAKVLGCFVVNEEFQPYEEHIQESQGKQYADIVHENFSPFMGRRWVKFGDRQVVAYQRRGDGIGWVTENEDDAQWTAMPDILENSQVGQFMILEAFRKHLEVMGLVDPLDRGPVQEGFSDLTETIYAYMKVEPFRDITKLHEGTPVAVLGYYKGSAIVEADGDIFWKPLEENAYWDQKNKDDAYYFNLDTNRDNLPDPLQALPSKPGLYTSKPRGVDNHNVQPELRKSVQHFGPNQALLGDEDFGVLGEAKDLHFAGYDFTADNKKTTIKRDKINFDKKGDHGADPLGNGKFKMVPSGDVVDKKERDRRLAESYIGTHGFTDDERLTDPCAHDIATEPGLEPADQDAQVNKDTMKKRQDTYANDDGKDAVPQDYDGEYGDEDVPDDETGAQEPVDEVEEAMDLIMDGADIDAVLGEKNTKRKETREALMREFFPYS